ncbi:MAG: hypothetical protein OZ917_09495 [Candidatus Brocadiaceae bacterium]|nr:hypothetical protein [Candidatus Brocadiaceae bacterium]
MLKEFTIGESSALTNRVAWTNSQTGSNEKNVSIIEPGRYIMAYKIGNREQKTFFPPTIDENIVS